MFNARKLITAAALALCAFAPTAASAAKVLYLSTAEWISEPVELIHQTRVDNGQRQERYRYKTTKDEDPAAETSRNLELHDTCFNTTGSSRHGIIQFILGASATSTTFAPDQKGALLSLYEAFEGNAFLYPGVLSPEAQIKTATCFNGSNESMRAPNKWYPEGEVPMLTRDQRCNFEGRTNAAMGNYVADARNKWKEVIYPKDGRKNILDEKGFGEGDVVVIHAIYQRIAADKAADIREMMKNYPKLTFALLLDTSSASSHVPGVCDTPDTVANLKDVAGETLFENNGWGSPSVVHLSNSNQYSAPANTSSKYAEKLTMPTLGGHTSGALMCIPKQNVVYTAPAPQDDKGTHAKDYPEYSDDPFSNGGYYCANSPIKNAGCGGLPDVKNFSSEWPELTASTAFGTLIPFWQNNAGEGGACIFLTQDSNIFDAGRGYQHKDLAEMIRDLPTTACSVTQKESGICEGLKESEKCLLVSSDETDPAKLDVIPSRQVKKDDKGNCIKDSEGKCEIDEAPKCNAMVWDKQCIPEKLAEVTCAAGETQGKEDCCCAADNIATTTDSGGNETKLCCGISEGTATDSVAAKSSAGSTENDTCCAPEKVAENAGTKTCCLDSETPLGDKGSQTCCTANVSERTTECTGDQKPETHCCKPKDPPPPTPPGPTCPSGQSLVPPVGGVCCEDDVNTRTATCDTAAGQTPENTCCRGCLDSDRPICTGGQIVSGDCGCKCNMPYEDRPFCEDGQVPAPYVKSGSTGDTKAAVVACCKPRSTPPTPGAGAPVPVNNPWALGLLGAAVAAFAARRQRHQSKRRDDA